MGIAGKRRLLAYQALELYVVFCTILANHFISSVIVGGIYESG